MTTGINIFPDVQGTQGESREWVFGFILGALIGGCTVFLFTHPELMKAMVI